MKPHIHFAFLCGIAFILGAMVGTICLQDDGRQIAALRQVALDADEEIARLNEQMQDERLLAAREVSRLNEQLISLYSQRPNVATPCFFPDLRTQ
jgi:hypothetical protein